MPRQDLIQYRRGSAASWAIANPVLADGEIGYVKDSNEIRVGDGLTAWLDLEPLGADTAQLATATAATVNDGRLSEPELLATITTTVEPLIEATATALIEEATAAPSGVVALRSSAGVVTRAVSSESNIYCAGDSLTFGTGDELSLGGWPGRLATLTGLSVVNGGVAGQSSSDIALRQGGLVPLVTVDANTIPSSGTVAVTSLKPSTSWRTANAFSFAGYVVDTAGVEQPVTLAHSGSSTVPDKSWTLARTSGSGAITIAADTPFYVKANDAYTSSILIAWTGRNNSSPNIYRNAKRDALAMIRHLNPNTPRYLVLSIINSTAEGTGTSNYGLIAEANAELAAEFGDNYVDIRGYLIANGLSDAGITPTGTDLTNIAADTIPTSLRATADPLHLNAAGYAVVAAYLQSVLVVKGWITGSVYFSSTFGGVSGAALDAQVGTAEWSMTDAGWEQDGSGNAYNTAPAATSYAVVDAAHSDCVVRVTMGGTFSVNGGLTLRYQDGSNHLAITWEDSSGTAPRLAKRVSGSSTVLTPSTQVAGVWAAGDVLEVTLNGPSIKLTKNGALVGAWSDSTFLTCTRHGLYVCSTGGSIKYADIRISVAPPLFYSSFGGAANAALDVEQGIATWSTTDANWKQDGSGNAYNSAPGSTSYAFLDVGAADCVITAVMAGTFSVNGGFTFRYQDGSNQLAITWEDVSGTAPRLAHRIANASTIVTPSTQVVGVWAAGDTIEVTLNGTLITCKKNGVIVGQWTDSTFSTLTKHGFFLRSTGGAIKYSSLRVGLLP